MSATNPSDVDNSVPKVSVNVGVEGLSKLLISEFSADYKEDIDKIKGAKIDGECFLSILKKEPLSLRIEVSHGFMIHLENKKQKLIYILEMNNTSNSSVMTNLKTPITPSHITSWCGTEIDAVIGSEVDSNSELLSACANPRCLWREKEVLIVEFLNSIPNWTYEGRDINFGNIISWAKEWSLRGDGVIPSFRKKRTNEAQSDIRILFNNNGNNKSLLGSKAENARSDEPTMWLDLSGKDNSYKKHLVIHEFGHALGLYHEHQRSDFWKHIEPYIDKTRMKADLDMSEDVFKERYEKLSKTVSASRTEYDPESVMHYWFKKDWLTHGYASEDKVKQDLEEGILLEKSAKAIWGVHKRHWSLADEPSALDMELLIKLYKDTNKKSSCTILGPPPTKKQRLSPAADDDEYCDIGSTSATRLNDDDHYSIYKKLKGKAAKWRVIGEALGFKEGEMENIQSHPALFMQGQEGFLREILSQWLQWAPGDGRGSEGFATRESLRAALLEANLGDLAKQFQ